MDAFIKLLFVPLNTCFCSLEFVENVHLNRKPFHLVGTSMGGNVAGVYAACYPTDICSMTLICPDGQWCVCVCACMCHVCEMAIGVQSRYEKGGKAPVQQREVHDFGGAK